MMLDRPALGPGGSFWKRRVSPGHCPTRDGKKIELLISVMENRKDMPRPTGPHFQILLSLTLLFLVALFWLSWMPHTNTVETRTVVASINALYAVQALGCYVACVAVLFGHAFLVKRDG